MVDFPRCEKDETEVRYMPYHWTEQRDICEGHRSPDDGRIESNQDHEAHFGPSEIHHLPDHLTSIQSVDTFAESNYSEFCSDQDNSLHNLEESRPDQMHNQITDHQYLDSEGYEIPLPYTDPHEGPLDPQATSFVLQINENFPLTILEPPEPPAPLATITLRSHTRSEYDLPSRHTLDFLQWCSR